MAKNPVQSTNGKLQEFKLPDGAVAFLKRPTNAVRRVLLEQPETNLRVLIELMAAACIQKIEFPANYGDADEAVTQEFSEEDNKADKLWERLDNLSLMDNQALVDAFQTLNLPSQKMIDDVISAVKSGKKE
jgi:hypothetical protein